MKTLFLIAAGDAAREGRPTYAVERDLVGDVVLSVARLRLAGWAGAVPTEAGFQPSVAVAGGNLILGSTESVVTRLAKALGSDAAASTAAPRQVLALLDIDLQRATILLEDARPLIVANNMLDSGKSRARLDREVDLLKKLAGSFAALTFELRDAGADRLELSLQLPFAPAEKR
jgi:hypothetical protein